MSLPKKKSRTVSFHDKHYRYTIKPTKYFNVNSEYGDLTLIVQEDQDHVDKPGVPLIVSLENIHITGGKNSGIGPGDVVKVIRQAIEKGWEPSNRGAFYIPKDIIEITRDE